MKTPREAAIEWSAWRNHAALADAIAARDAEWQSRVTRLEEALRDASAMLVEVEAGETIEQNVGGRTPLGDAGLDKLRAAITRARRALEPDPTSGE